MLREGWKGRREGCFPRREDKPIDTNHQLRSATAATAQMLGHLDDTVKLLSVF